MVRVSLKKIFCSAVVVYSVPYSALSATVENDKDSELFIINKNFPPILLQVSAQFLTNLFASLLGPIGFTNPLSPLQQSLNLPASSSQYDTLMALEGPQWMRSSQHIRLTQEVKESDASEIILKFVRDLGFAVGDTVLNVNKAMYEIEKMPRQFASQLAALLDAYGDAFLRTIELNDNPISSLVQQLVVPTHYTTFPTPHPQVNVANDRPHVNDVSSAKLMESITPAESIAARMRIVSLARKMGEHIGLGGSYGAAAEAFVDEFLIPAGLTTQVADIMKEQVANFTSTTAQVARESQRQFATTAASRPFSRIVELGASLGRLVGTTSYHRNVANSFASMVLGPLGILDSVSSMLDARVNRLEDFFNMKANLLHFAGMTENNLLSTFFIPKGLAAMVAEAGNQVLHATANPDFMMYPKRECDAALKAMLTFCEMKQLGQDCVNIAGDAYRNICLEQGKSALVKAIASGELLFVTPQIKLDAICEKVYTILFNYGQQTGQGDGYYYRLYNFRSSCENKKADGLCPVIRDKLLVYCASFNAEVEIVEECTAQVEAKFGDCGVTNELNEAPQSVTTA